MRKLIDPHDKQNHIWTVAVPAVYWNPQAHTNEFRFIRRVRAISRRDALKKCLPEIVKLLESSVTTSRLPGGPRFSVYVGLTHEPTAEALRLDPYKIDRSGRVIDRVELYEGEVGSCKL